MHIKPIHNKDDYEKALVRIETLMDAKPHTKEFDELDVLSTLVDAYDQKEIPIESPDPIEAIRFRMDQMGYTRQDIQKEMQYSRGRISEILNKKRPLTLKMIREFGQKLHIPTTVLVQEYAIDGRYPPRG